MSFQLEAGAELDLRVLQEADAAQLYALADSCRLQLRQWLPWVDQTLSADDTRRFIAAALRRFADNGGLACGIWHRGRLAGSIDLHQIDWANRAASIGYWLAPEFQGRGLMTTACHTLIEYAFRVLQLNRVEIRCATGNLRSCAIPERLGFTREGVIRQGQWVSGRYLDLVVYGLLAEEWLQGGSASP